MSDVDLDLWWLEPPSRAEENPYIELGRVLSGEFIEESIERDLDGLDIEDCEPLERVVRLMKAGDQHVLLDSDPNEAWLYGLAVESVLDPHVQLELGCLLLQRADVDEPPLCEHLYPQQDFAEWDPHTEIHEELGPGPLSRERTETIQLALRAYGHAWSFYKWGWSRVGAHYVIRTLLVLDGLRVCYSELEDRESMWKLCSGLKPWLGTVRYKFGARGGELDEFVADVEKRFARTRGRLEPLVAGRIEARKRLERELEYFDKLPTLVADYLIDGEYMRSLLKDPSYNPKGIVAIYCQAVEAMLQWRLGEVIDTYLKGAPKPESDSFKSEFLQSKNDKGRVLKEWRCADLSINAFTKHIKNAAFKNVLSKVGADSKFVFKELPSALWKLLDYRNPASHAHSRPFTEEGVSEARVIVLHVLVNLDRLMPMLTQRESQDG